MAELFAPELHRLAEKFPELLEAAERSVGKDFTDTVPWGRIGRGFVEEYRRRWAMSRIVSPECGIGERIKVRRLMRSWSVRFAADRAGISHASWSRIERGLQAVDNRLVPAGIAAALECSVADLIGMPMPLAGRWSAAAQAGVVAVRRARETRTLDVARGTLSDVGAPSGVGVSRGCVSQRGTMPRGRIDDRKPSHARHGRL
ncbi:helix-turn-helix domain-containing protein [Paractinoplanes lichenicola]|uniref:helix-turn-helix domain-containing protein n=1 Tax=Paractinoplanes lichenicola TaxID=2802976 RepID=UPI001F3F9FDC|nr:helix-turn-helix transcriptional regulator [Actinoplanes lichenicola]